MSHIAQRTLPDGTVATITADRLYPGALQLEIDGTPQSHVNLQRPKELAFEYMQRIANIIDAYAKPGSPITALHLGGGAFTIPRYIAASRPGSAQQVIELNGELVDFVREYMPLPRREQIRIRRGDARAVARGKNARRFARQSRCLRGGCFSGRAHPSTPDNT